MSTFNNFFGSRVVLRELTAPASTCHHTVHVLMVICFSTGVGALTFVSPTPPVLLAYLSLNMDINCTTDEPSATVKLLHQPTFTNWVERAVKPSKLILTGQVFTLLNVIVSDGGRYKCEATYKNETIEWPTGVLAVIRTGKLNTSRIFTLQMHSAIQTFWGSFNFGEQIFAVESKFLSILSIVASYVKSKWRALQKKPCQKSLAFLLLLISIYHKSE